VLLNGIIGEMYLWCKVVDVELVGRGADVALLVPVSPGDSEKVADQHIVPDIEFPVVVEHRPVDVHLHDVGLLSLLSVLVCCVFCIGPTRLQDRI